MFNNGDKRSRLGRGRKRLSEKLKECYDKEWNENLVTENNLQPVILVDNCTPKNVDEAEYVDYKTRWEKSELKSAIMASSERNCFEILCSIKESLESFSLAYNIGEPKDSLEVISVIRNSVSRIPHWQHETTKHYKEVIQNTSSELEDCKQQVRVNYIFKIVLVLNFNTGETTNYQFKATARR